MSNVQLICLTDHLKTKNKLLVFSFMFFEVERLSSGCYNIM